LEGLNARIVQHEVDHLDWILFVDKIVWKEKNFNFLLKV
jgi:peptide deformylase